MIANIHRFNAIQPRTVPLALPTLVPLRSVAWRHGDTSLWERSEIEDLFFDVELGEAKRQLDITTHTRIRGRLYQENWFLLLILVPDAS